MHRGWNKLSESFRSRFDVVPATTPSLRDAVYRVRHAVYCEEFGFERTTAAQREMDQYDARSTALLIRDASSGEFIACARIVHTDSQQPDEALPFELATGGRLNGAAMGSQSVPRSRVAEISRLAVVSQFRRRRTDAGSPAPLSENDFAEGPWARFPFILAGLYLGILAIADLEGLMRLYLLTEERLAKHIHRIGVNITPIGEPVVHRGLRVPSVIDVPAVTAGLRGHIKPLYEEIHTSIAASFKSAEAGREAVAGCLIDRAAGR